MRALLTLIFFSTAPVSAAPFGPAVPAVAKTTAAQQAIALYRDEYRHGYVACPSPTRANEVVICGNGRGGSANRIPLPDQRTPPDWARQAVGEIPTGTYAMTADYSGNCFEAHCAARANVDLIAAGVRAVQLVRALADPEGASDYADRHSPKPWADKK